MHHFDEPSLLKTLNALPVSAQSAFAQACAIRTQHLAASPLGAEAASVCQRALDHAHAYVVAGELDSASIEQALAVMNASPELDDDRVAACAYVVRHLLSGECQEAAWAARRAYEACDQLAQSEIEFDVYSKAIELQLLGHEAVQAELRRQDLDLSELLINPASCETVLARASHRM
jgi:hypothetical protein